MIVLLQLPFFSRFLHSLRGRILCPLHLSTPIAHNMIVLLQLPFFSRFLHSLRGRILCPLHLSTPINQDVATLLLLLSLDCHDVLSASSYWVLVLLRLCFLFFQGFGHRFWLRLVLRLGDDLVLRNNAAGRSEKYITGKETPQSS